MPTKKWLEEHKEDRRKYGRTWRMKMKITVLSHYSLHGFPECVRCGEKDLIVLCLDHIDGGGKKELRKYPSHAWYSKLIKESFPEGYQTLCFNCNARKEFNEDLKREPK